MERNSRSYPVLILSAVAINFAVLITFVALSVLQFGQVRSELERERLWIVADRAAEPLASAAKIGLDLASVRNLSALLERSRQSDGALIALKVLSPDGAVIMNTLGSTDTVVGTQTLRRLREPGLSSSYKENGDFRYLIPFQDGTGNLVGALLTEYSGAAANASVWAMAGRLATAALLLCVIGSLASALAVRAALKPEVAIDQRAANADLDLVRQLWRGSTGKLTLDFGETFENGLKEAEDAYLRARSARS